MTTNERIAVEENKKELMMEVLAAVVVNLDTLRDAHLRHRVGEKKKAWGMSET